MWANLAVAAGDKISETIRADILSASMEYGLLSGMQISSAQETATKLWAEKVGKSLIKNMNKEKAN